MQDESSFTPRTCRRCGRVIFTGRYGGLMMSLDLGVSGGDARTLTHFGVVVLALRLRNGGLWADDYDPGAPAAPNSHLAAPHVCGSDHSKSIDGGRSDTDRRIDKRAAA